MSRPSFFQLHRRGLLIGAALAVTAVLAAAGALAIYSPRLTPIMEGPALREELDRQTSKGLHFRGRYEPLHRTGFASVETAGFDAEDGVKAMKTLRARDITARFNPWGVLLRRWQLDYVHIKTGDVELQAYEPKPDNRPPKPWYSIFLPDRVYLREVTCETANVRWRLGDRLAGIFGTQLLITPSGRDFEYRATGGRLRSSGLAPELGVKAIHLLITKKILEAYQLELSAGEGTIRLTGEMGMRDDKHIAAALEIARVPLAPWLPDEWGRNVQGILSGNASWRGEDQTLAAGTGEGEARITGGKIANVPLLEYLATATRQESLENVVLDECSAKFRWKHPRLEVSAIDIRSGETFALRGSLAIEGTALSGTIELGMAPASLDWLPRAKEDIFTRAEGGLLWTTVHLSGTTHAPKTDLGPKLATALQRDPAAATGLFFRGAGEWLEQKFRAR